MLFETTHTHLQMFRYKSNMKSFTVNNTSMEPPNKTKLLRHNSLTQINETSLRNNTTNNKQSNETIPISKTTYTQREHKNETSTAVYFHCVQSYVHNTFIHRGRIGNTNKPVCTDRGAAGGECIAMFMCII